MHSRGRCVLPQLELGLIYCQTVVTTSQQIGRWRLVRRLGSGYFGETWEAQDSSGDIGLPIALKLVGVDSLGHSHRQSAIKEVDALFRISHEHVLAVRSEPADVELDGRRYLVFGVELCDDSLRSVADRCSDRDALLRWAIPHLLSGLAHLHRKGLVHRDLHPGNMLVSGHTWKIADLGLARPATGEGTYIPGVAGAREYVAPEVAQGGPATHAADVYAFGVLVHWLLTGQYLFAPADDLGVIASSMPTISPSLPGDWREFIAAAVSPAASRPTADTLSTLVPAVAADFNPDRLLRGDDLLVSFTREGVAGRTLFKLSPKGYHHRVHLRPDGTLTESPVFDPLAIWEGRWRVTSAGVLSIKVGDYELRLSHRWRPGWPAFVGTETNGHGESHTLYAVFGTPDGRPSSTVAKVLRDGVCWMERLAGRLTDDSGGVEERPLFDPTAGSWSGSWRSMVDHRGAARLVLQFGPYLLAATRAGSEWQGPEIETAASDQRLIDHLPTTQALFDPTDTRFVLLEVDDVV